MRGLTSFVWAASLLWCTWLVAGEEPTVESLVAGVADQDPAAAVAAIDGLDKIEPATKAAVPAVGQRPWATKTKPFVGTRRRPG